MEAAQGREAPAGGRAADATAWHALEAERVGAELGTDPQRGLSPDEAAERLRRHGPNQLPDEEREHALVRLLKQFRNVLIYILIIAAFFTAFLGEWIDTGVIIAVVLVNAVIGYVQEGKAARAMEELRRMLSPTALVLRAGRRHTVDAAELVPGDVVLLTAGDRVPADLRVIEAHEARVDEAALTGESEPVAKSAAAVPADALLGDRSSMAYSGTLITGGRLHGAVVGTGVDTEVGRIGSLVAGVETMKTPLLERVEQFGKLLSMAIVGLGVLLFLFGWLLRGFAVEDMFLVVVSFAVAAIPEGLPAILTITLALGVQRMGRRNAIIRRLPAVETLGSVTTICSDKTGTLTRNELAVGQVLLSGGAVSLDDAPAEPTGPLRTLCEAAVLCNDADLPDDTASDAADRAVGDPMDAALLRLADRLDIDAGAVRARHPRLDAIPFESANRYMATLHEAPDGDRLVCVKGAPERILEMCGREVTQSGGAALDASRWLDRVEQAAADGYRMLAIAVASRRSAGGSLDQRTLDDLSLAGVIGLMDPPRDEAAAAVAECRQAGIRVIMITGDHASTARSIADRLEIGRGGGVITGREIEHAEDATLGDLVQQYDVIARASPEHKLRLVRALQSGQHVVAMTGDGVNDAPALKQADIGVAMGIKGTEAAKSAAEMVLADDNFASIERAVEEGRTVYDNLRKTILFILPTNGAEALMVLSAVAFALPELPITPVQILWVNMVTAVTLALAFAFEPTEPDIMRRPPRARTEPILSTYLMTRIAYVSVLVAAACIGLFLLELDAGAGAGPRRARTIAVNALVVAEVFYLFNCRSVWASALTVRGVTGNRAAVAAVAVLIPLQLAFTYAPFMQAWFGTAPLGAVDWAWCLLVGVAVFAVVETEKALGRRRHPHSARSPS